MERICGSFHGDSALYCTLLEVNQTFRSGLLTSDPTICASAPLRFCALVGGSVLVIPKNTLYFDVHYRRL